MITDLMRTFALSSLVALVLVSCSTANIDPNEVLQRAMEQARTVESASIEGSVQFRGVSALAGGDVQFNSSFQGRMHDSGHQLDVTFAASVAPLLLPFSVDATGQLIVAGPNEAYVRLQSLDTGLLDLGMSESSLNQWFRITPTASGANVVTTVTPDPSFIAMQTSILSLSEERGIESVNGRKAHRLGVIADKEKLATYLARIDEQAGRPSNVQALRDALEPLSFQGDVWVDVATFDILRLKWSVASSDTTSTFDALLDCTFSDINQANVIEPPSESMPLPMNAADLFSATGTTLPFILQPQS